MCSSRASSVGRRHRSGPGKHWGHSAKWSGVNIAAMVIGFVFFWPVGLVVLFWILSGRPVQELPGAVKQQWSRIFGGDKDNVESEGNIVFNEYQQTQYDRIREIKEEIVARSQRFGDFRMNAKRRADQAEFSDFMSSSPQSGSANPVSG